MANEEMTPEEFLANEERYVKRNNLNEALKLIVDASGMTAVEVMFVLSAFQYSLMGAVVTEDIKIEVEDALGPDPT